MRHILLGTIAVTVVSLGSVYGTRVKAVQPARTEKPVSDALSVPSPKSGRSRPLIVVVGENAGAETTDFVIPYGVLKDSGVADVLSLSTGAGPVQLLRALRITADQTIAEFDAAEPRGADIVIVPAQAAPKDPALTAWVRSQAAKGAVLVSVCEGARVLAKAGLLDGKRATTHWSALQELDKAYPRTTWVRDRRYVQDGAVISTTGVTASLPMSLALVEAIGGHAVAEATAERLGAKGWTAAHRTADFQLGRGDFLRAVGAYLAFWTHESIELPLTDGIDEVALALRSDTWTRSYRARVITTSPSQLTVTSKHGLRIIPDAAPRAGRFVIPQGRGSTVAQLDQAIDGMARRYGPAARRFAVTGLEYSSASAGR
jgi:putative intracellular protease/amidase